jgi:predicted RNase H-like HicB family nuclease
MRASTADALSIEGGSVMRLKVVLEPSDDGGYTVYVPSLPGCISEGETVEDALKNIREAIELYLEPVEQCW